MTSSATRAAPLALATCAAVLAACAAGRPGARSGPVGLDRDAGGDIVTKSPRYDRWLRDARAATARANALAEAWPATYRRFVEVVSRDGDAAPERVAAFARAAGRRSGARVEMVGALDAAGDGKAVLAPFSDGDAPPPERPATVDVRVSFRGKPGNGDRKAVESLRVPLRDTLALQHDLVAAAHELRKEIVEGTDLWKSVDEEFRDEYPDWRDAVRGEVAARVRELKKARFKLRRVAETTAILQGGFHEPNE